jgi:hypothetical protein
MTNFEGPRDELLPSEIFAICMLVCFISFPFIIIIIIIIIIILIIIIIIII